MVKALRDTGGMYVRMVLWNLDDSDATLEQLRAYLGTESVDQFAKVEGLRLKLWVADPSANQWGAIYLWESRAASSQTLPSKARALIGKDPDEIREFDLEASIEGVSSIGDLSRLGKAFSEGAEILRRP